MYEGFEDIKKAVKRIDKVVHKTPLAYAPILSKKYNHQIFLKKDNLQVTGSFKTKGSF